MSLLDRLEVPLAQSLASTIAVVRPRVTASSALPAPTTPPPTTSTSSSRADIPAMASARANGDSAAGDTPDDNTLDDNVPDDNAPDDEASDDNIASAPIGTVLTDDSADIHPPECPLDRLL